QTSFDNRKALGWRENSAGWARTSPPASAADYDALQSNLGSPGRAKQVRSPAQESAAVSRPFAPCARLQELRSRRLDRVSVLLPSTAQTGTCKMRTTRFQTPTSIL